LIIIYSLYNIRKKYFFRLLIAIVPLLMAFIYFNKDILTIYYQFNYTKFDGSALSSFPIRLWSIKHNLALLFKYPLFGVGIGSTGALSGIVSMLAGIGFIGCIILAISFKNINIRKNKGILFALLGLLSYNLFAGDLSTVFSPIAALYFATSSRLNIC